MSMNGENIRYPPQDCPHWIQNRSSRLFFHDMYLNEYLKLNNLNTTEFNAWELPTAAIRLAEGIPSEERQLSVLLRKHYVKFELILGCG